MKKIFMFLAVMGVMAFSAQNAAAQDEQPADTTATEVVAETTEATDALPEEVPMHQALKTKFIEGGAGFMALVIACLILGLALCIERILYLSFSKTNTKKLLAKIEEALQNGGVEAATEVCRNTRGPVASIFTQAFLRLADGQSLEEVEKSVVSYGGVAASQMEQNLSWISLFIAIAPSLGFLGTVIGMIQAFDAIMVAGDMSPAVVAGGMKVALITTVGGLIVAVILQIFYNYILSQVESLTIDMEDATISLMDILVKYQGK
ncbi:MAG: MotA/TolQ/ExbB proton channel family protein [Bacteroidales bacterium]|nr:MotA/TolQ/ExbB proton channel family protein [Bacteroidales bacterium]MBQ2919186.1 MotA/TolQ/ExbB proton channel family protein [Bacteroidales bacterium]